MMFRKMLCQGCETLSLDLAKADNFAPNILSLVAFAVFEVTTIDGMDRQVYVLGYGRGREWKVRSLVWADVEEVILCPACDHL